MALSSYDAVAEKVLCDLEMAVKKDTSINEFDVVPVSEAENRNSSPILKGECSLGLESWIIPHIYPFAHHQIMQKSNYKTQNLDKVISCLLAAALLNPEMATVWSRRRELILSKKMHADNELRLTRMALSRKPKSNEALAHRRWIITEILKNVKDKAVLLQEELSLSEMIANRYHSNYHAWSHRMWSLQHLLPHSHHWNYKKKCLKSSILHFSSTDISNLFCNVTKSKYLSVINSEVFHIYAEELENSFKWISCHISDYSGFHYRKFLINEIFDFLKVFLCSDSDFDLGNEEGLFCMNSQSKLSSCFFPSRKIILTEFLKQLENDNQYKKMVEEYLTNLQENCSLFDLMMSLLVSEIKSNHTLCLTFPGHEALWYYRRCLINFFKQYVLDGLQSSEQIIFSHQDKNGVPYKKDFKYDYTLKLDDRKQTTTFSDIFRIFHTCLVKNEERVILSALKSTDENEKKIVKNYENWLKFYLRINEKFI